MSSSSRRMRTTLATAAAAALALPAAALAQGDDRDRDRGGSSGSHHRTTDRFATIKDGSKLVVFDGRTRHVHRIHVAGAPVMDRFVGIDVRPTGPKAGGLYGITAKGGIYLIDPRDGSAQLVSTSTVALVGSSFGVDFNPVVDRLRVVSSADQNLRINVDTGEALVDGAIAYAAGDRNAGRNPAATGAGYVFAPFGGDPATTTLYDVDAQRDVLTTQAPPNLGTLNTVGSLQRDVQYPVGFDIAGESRPEAFGLFRLNRNEGKSTLYRVSLRTGKAQSTGITLSGHYDGLAALDGHR